MFNRLAIVALCLSVVFAAPVFRPNLGAVHNVGSLAFVTNSTNCTTNYYGSNCDRFCDSTTCNTGSCLTTGTDAGRCSCTNTTRGAFCNETLPTSQASKSGRLGATGGTLDLGSGRKFKLTLPAGALSADVDLEIFQYARGSIGDTSATQPQLSSAGGIIRLLPKGTTFTTPITVTFEVDTDITVPTGFTIKVFKLDETANEWNQVGGTYDPSTGTIDVELSSFSFYSPFVVADSSSSSLEFDGNSDHSIVIAIVASVLIATFLFIGGMWTIVYFRNKDNQEVAVAAPAQYYQQPVQYYQQPVQYTAAA